MEHRDLTNHIIGLAIEVHRTAGPGLLESAYGECLSEELEQAGIPFQREIMVPVVYNRIPGCLHRILPHTGKPCPEIGDVLRSAIVCALLLVSACLGTCVSFRGLISISQLYSWLPSSKRRLRQF